MSKSASEKSVFLDVNIFMDILQQRSNWQHSLIIANAVRAKRIKKGYVSSLTVAIIYFLRKNDKKRRITDRQARQDAKTSIEGFEILPVDSSHISSSVDDKRFKDFEDAIQFRSAKGNADVIITRNKKHYSKVANMMEIRTPEEFIARYKI